MKFRTSMVLHQPPRLNPRQQFSPSRFFASAAAPAMIRLLVMSISTHDFVRPGCFWHEANHTVCHRPWKSYDKKYWGVTS
jgi:hypothetical protein